jgi:hypothetical protein
MSTIELSHIGRKIEYLVSRYANDKIKIPEHQRNANVWTEVKRKLFIDSCKKNMPSPSILIYTDENGEHWLEDGLQRVTTLKNFIQDKFADSSNRKYSEWSELEKFRFGNYEIIVVEYSGATEEERVMIFDRFQNGTPLKVGERLHALSYTPLVKFTKEMFMKYINSDGIEMRGKYLDRAQLVWGAIKCDNTDKRYDELLKLVALINGIVHGWKSCKGITKSYEELNETLMTSINNEMRDKAEQVIKELFLIYEEADVRYPLHGKKHLNVQKNIGNFTGAIVYSLKMFPDDWERLHNGWVDFLVCYRKDNSLLETKIKKNVADCRNWTEGRWETTYKHVFNIAGPSDNTKSSPSEDSDEDE